MKEINKQLLSTRINAYLTNKLRETFGEDFSLIEKDIDKLIERYSLKELIIIGRLEIDRIKNPRRQ